MVIRNLKNLQLMELKNGIPSEEYYELLDWKDKNLEEFQKLFPGKALNDLTQLELIMLYNRVLIDT
jgi:hypothetical protein